MTSRLRSALLTGAVAATLALGAAPAQADNQQDPAALPAAEQTAPAPDADLGSLEENAQEAAPVTEAAPATDIVPAEPAPGPVPVPMPVPAEEVLADALIPVLVEETETNDDGGTPAGTAEEATEDVAGGDVGAVDPVEDGTVDTPDSGSEEEQAPVPDPADSDSEVVPGPGTDLSPGAETEPAPTTPVRPGTPSAPAPSTPQAPVPAGFESIVVGGRTLTHADFNIPDEIAAGDEATIARWMEENIDVVLESEGMIYLLDLMMDYLEAGDLEGLAGLIREMSVSDPAAGEELILWMYELFDGVDEWPAEFGEDHIYVGAPGVYEVAPAAEPAPAVSPASVEVVPAALVPAQKPAEQSAAPAGELAETGAAGTVWLATGGAGLLLLGVALVALRRRLV